MLHHVFLFTELEVLLAMVGAAATRLKQRLDLIYGNRSDDDRDTGTIPFKYRPAKDTLLQWRPLI